MKEKREERESSEKKKKKKKKKERERINQFWIPAFLFLGVQKV